MITHKFIRSALGATSYRNLICEISESQRWGYGYFSVKLLESAAGWKYRTQYSTVVCDGFVGIGEWLDSYPTICRV